MIKNSRCYAQKLGDCSKAPSKEHILSKDFLKGNANSGKDELIRISGFTWLSEGEYQDLPIATMYSRVLCETHNSKLSPFDKEAGRFRRTLQEFDQYLLENWTVLNKSSPPRPFNGSLLERWMLKVLCGLAYSGAAETKGIAKKKWLPPNKWLQILWGKEAFPIGCGLYCLPEFVSIKGWSFVIFSNSLQGPYALKMSIDEKTFILAMDDKLIKTHFSSAIFHPAVITTSKGANEYSLLINWGTSGPAQSVTFVKPI